MSCRRFVPLVAVLAAAVAAPAAARPADVPRVEVQPVAGLAPDGRSVTVDVLASCPERWTLVEAVVAVSQPQGSGRAPFPLACVGFLRPITVVVPLAAGDSFALGSASVTASVTARRGKVARATDTEFVAVEPRVSVDVASTGRLAPGGGAVTLDVAVACPDGTTGRPSTLNVTQGNTTGNGAYTPVCDGARHTSSVTVQAREGTYAAGGARALTFADVEHDGRTFTGVGDAAVTLAP